MKSIIKVFVWIMVGVSHVQVSSVEIFRRYSLPQISQTSNINEKEKSYSFLPEESRQGKSRLESLVDLDYDDQHANTNQGIIENKVKNREEVKIKLYPANTFPIQDKLDIDTVEDISKYITDDVKDTLRTPRQNLKQNSYPGKDVTYHHQEHLYSQQKLDYPDQHYLHPQEYQRPSIRDNADYKTKLKDNEISSVQTREDVENDEITCMNKISQIEETVYDHKIKCQHTFTEKCHDTFITDYVPTQEEKCETSYTKDCHISYKPHQYKEHVQVCNQPLQKLCGEDLVGPEICKVHYETICEKRFKMHEALGDVPMCHMETVSSCCQWSEWSPCSVSCGRGTRTRTRQGQQCQQRGKHQQEECVEKCSGGPSPVGVGDNKISSMELRAFGMENYETCHWTTPDGLRLDLSCTSNVNCYQERTLESSVAENRPVAWTFVKVNTEDQNCTIRIDQPTLEDYGHWTVELCKAGIPCLNLTHNNECTYQDWGDWSQCSSSCGHGSRLRRKRGNGICKDKVESGYCNNGPCQNEIGSGEEETGRSIDIGRRELNTGKTISQLGRIESPLFEQEEECEEWQVQKCEIVKKAIKKFNPETSCRKESRNICAPGNCIVQKAPEVCRNETQNVIQNIPKEECDLKPQDNCSMETILVPKLVAKKNCVNIPKEVCINEKTNPRKKKRPVVKEWCYRTSDLENTKNRKFILDVKNN